jgi:acyl-CoA synthetase (AMP-forming)/AMP-acid ligase II
LIHDPRGDAPGARLYATGDWVRHSPGGALDVRGRVDAQLQVRGVRVEPAELELALHQHAAVHDAVVIVHAAAAGERSRRLPGARRRADGGRAARVAGRRMPPALVPEALVWLAG